MATPINKDMKGHNQKILKIHRCVSDTIWFNDPTWHNFIVEVLVIFSVNILNEHFTYFFSFTNQLIHLVVE